ncbi:MAG: hypothetical protein ABI670_08775 [Chloroflexota bacterium]
MSSIYNNNLLLPDRAPLATALTNSALPTIGDPRDNRQAREGSVIFQPAGGIGHSGEAGAYSGVSPLKYNAAQSSSLPWVQYCGYDTAYVSFRYSRAVRRRVMSRLAGWRKRARRSPSRCYQVPGLGLYMWAESYGAYDYVLGWPGKARIAISTRSRAAFLPPVYVRLSSANLYANGLRGAVQDVAMLLRQLFGAPHKGYQLSRIDLAVDSIGFVPYLSDLAKPSRYRTHLPYTVVDSNAATGQINSMYFGTERSPLQVVIYNKTRHIVQTGESKHYPYDIYDPNTNVLDLVTGCAQIDIDQSMPGDRATYEGNIWDVYRIELRLTREYLRSKGINTLDDLDEGGILYDVMGHIESGRRGRVRLCDRSTTDSNPSRWPMSAEWASIRDQAIAYAGTNGVVYEPRARAPKLKTTPAPAPTIAAQDLIPAITPTPADPQIGEPAPPEPDTTDSPTRTRAGRPGITASGRRHIAEPVAQAHQPVFPDAPAPGCHSVHIAADIGPRITGPSPRGPPRERCFGRGWSTYPDWMSDHIRQCQQRQS